MPSAEEEEERAVFDDDDDDDDVVGDDTEEDYEDYEGDDAEAAPPPSAAPTAAAAPPPPATANPAAAAEENLNDSTPSTSSSSSDRAAPNPNPNPWTAADPQNGAIPVLPISAAAPAAAAAGSLFTPTSSDPVPQPSEDRKPVPVAVAAVSGGYDDSRRLFQRLWTDEDEITILKGFLEFTSRRGTTFASHQYDTGPFYEEIKKQLELEFTKNQLIEKLRRLKKKYRNVVSRMRSMGKDFAFKSSHEKAIYDIARNIWSANVKRTHDSDDDDPNTPNNAYAIEAISGPDGAINSDRRMSRSRRRFRRRTAEETTATATAAAAAAATTTSPATVGVPVTQVPSSSAAAIPGIIEETVKSCLSPLFKELICSATGGPLGPGLSGGAGLLGPGLGGAAAALGPIPFCLGGSPASLPGSGAAAAAADEKWKKQQILELEVYLKRIELLRDQIKSTLGELKSSGS